MEVIVISRVEEIRVDFFTIAKTAIGVVIHRPAELKTKQKMMKKVNYCYYHY